MEINCPSCNEAVLIADEDMAKTFECPFCQQSLEFDKPEPPPIEEPPPPIEEPPPPIEEPPPPIEEPPPPIEKTPPIEEPPPPIEKTPPVSDEAKRVLTSNLLILCPACSKAVSKQADICLNCGHPIYHGVLGKAGASRAINITVLALLVTCVFFCLIANNFQR